MRSSPTMKLALALLFPGLITGWLFTSCAAKKEKDARVQQLKTYLEGQQQFYRFNGNVLVAENGKVLLQQSFGYADFTSGRPLNDSSVFELASVSKQFTATAILLLRDKGKLQLTDPLQRYFPELPYPGVTLWHMLTHTSGLPDYESAMNEKWDPSRIAFNNDMIAFLAAEKIPAVFEPGKNWEYSNTAYAILASIVEKVSGQTFAAFLSENIFRPLGMRHSRVYNTRRSRKDTIANYAYGFEYDDSLKKYFLPDSLPDLRFVIYLDGIQGDGVVNSTTGDLLKWDRALKEHTLLKKETQEEMLKGQSLVDTVQNSMYGYGVFLEKTEEGNMISHSGGWPGYATYLARNTDRDQTFIVLSNNSGPAPAISKALQAIMAGKPVVMPRAHKAIRLDSATLDLFTGTYLAPNEVRLERKGERIFRVGPGGRELELFPASDTVLFYNDGTDRQWLFEKGPDGKPAKAWLVNYGIKRELKKK